MLRTTALTACLALGAVGVAACGSSSSSSSSSSTASPATTVDPYATVAPSPTVSSVPPSTGPTVPTGPAVAGTFGVKPVVSVPDGPPPTTLQSQDLIVGTGPAAKSGDNVTVQYVGVSYTTKQQFDASWDSGSPFPFPLGAGRVIKGWDQGVAGMQVGGRRQLIIPPDLAYGAQSPGHGIVANDTLIFMVDMIKIG